MDGRGDDGYHPSMKSAPKRCNATGQEEPQAKGSFVYFNTESGRLQGGRNENSL